MRRSHTWRRNVHVAIVAAVALCGCGAGASLAADHGRGACGSCTSGVGAGYARAACMPGRCGNGVTACGPRGCGPCGSGHGCRRPCCPDVCCPGPCEGCGHCIHHDVYEKRYFLRSQGKSWHSAWYDPAEGRPIALVVPPTAEFQSQYGWGVPSSRVAPIYHQFRRPYPGPGAVGGSGGGFLPTPNHPSDTVQFGVSAVRGPWAY
ncbi:MAG: hypothetical protein ACKOZU_02930 [Planctomycetaceae bacterium]